VTSLASFRTWAATLKGDVILPVDSAYDAARRIWNLDIDRRPALIVRCADEDDVVRAVDFARTRGLVVAVRSGGHSQAGHSVCDGGMLIDLGRLNHADVDPRRRVARVAAGMRVGAMLDATGVFGLTTPTGDCPDVGIAGLTLGGGESLLMARHGAVCDNVMSARVVTAGGRMMTASADENADLYWAIRGGGGNFGIVTALYFRLHPLARVLSGRLIFPVSRARDVMRRYRDLMAGAPDELQTSGGLLSSEDEPVLFIAVCHCGEADSANSLIQGWRASLRPESDNVKWIPHSSDFILPAVASSGTGSFLPELSDEVIDVLADSFSSAPPSCTAAWNDYHGAVTRVLPGAMAFPLRHPGYDVFVHATWKTAESRSDALTWLSELHGALRRWERGVYVNNIGTESAERTAAAYGANFERLMMIKAKYDPDNFFHLNHNIRPFDK
jgi:FAD/FMN-containing dehydrogenase